MLANLSMLLFFFNLLPIPPLDGSYLLKHLIGMSWETFQMLGRYGFFALILVLQWPPVGQYLATATAVSVHLIAKASGIDVGRF
jgi:Zn-dependent protease